MAKIKARWDKIPIAVKVSTAYAICNVLQRCLSFITLPLFTRLLTTEQYGQMTIYQSWTGILSILLTLNLAYGSFSTAMVKFEDDRDGYIASVEGICLVLSLCFLILYLPFQNLWNKLFDLPTSLMCLMLAELLGTTAIQLWSGKKRFEFSYKSVVGVTLGMSVLSPILAYILVINSDEKGYARILGYSLVTVVIGGILYLRNAAKGKKIYNKEYWKYALGFNIPLLAYYLSQMIFNQSDRIMISHLTSTSDAAMYGVAYNLAMILTFVLNAINNSYVPWMYGKIKEGSQEKNKPISVVIAVLMALMILCVIWFAPEIITIMAGKQYAAAVYVVAPVGMSLLLLFYVQLFINVEFYYEEKKMLVWASIGAAVLNIVLNYIFIPRYGFVAAGYTTLASYIVFVLSNFAAMQKLLKQKNLPDNMYDYKMLFLVAVLFMASGFLGVALYNFLFTRIVITILVCCVLVVFRKTFIDTLKIIKGR